MDWSIYRSIYLSVRIDSIRQKFVYFTLAKLFDCWKMKDDRCSMLLLRCYGFRLQAGWLITFRFCRYCSWSTASIRSAMRWGFEFSSDQRHYIIKTLRHNMTATLLVHLRLKWASEWFELFSQRLLGWIVLQNKMGSATGIPWDSASHIVCCCSTYVANLTWWIINNMYAHSAFQQCYWHSTFCSFRTNSSAPLLINRSIGLILNSLAKFVLRLPRCRWCCCFVSPTWP